MNEKWKFREFFGNHSESHSKSPPHYISVDTVTKNYLRRRSSPKESGGGRGMKILRYLSALLALILLACPTPSIPPTPPSPQKDGEPLPTDISYVAATVPIDGSAGLRTISVRYSMRRRRPIMHSSLHPPSRPG